MGDEETSALRELLRVERAETEKLRAELAEAKGTERLMRHGLVAAVAALRMIDESDGGTPIVVRRDGSDVRAVVILGAEDKPLMRIEAVPGADA